MEANSDHEKTNNKSTLHKEKSTQKKEKPADCKYHLGYLSEREQKERIPDDCICCKESLECMLRKIRQ